MFANRKHRIKKRCVCHIFWWSFAAFAASFALRFWHFANWAQLINTGIRFILKENTVKHSTHFVTESGL
jgi:hypothetical protein